MYNLKNPPTKPGKMDQARKSSLAGAMFHHETWDEAHTARDWAEMLGRGEGPVWTSLGWMSAGDMDNMGGCPRAYGPRLN